jgi:hypothetical protein
MSTTRAAGGAPAPGITPAGPPMGRASPGLRSPSHFTPGTLPEGAARVKRVTVLPPAVV